MDAWKHPGRLDGTRASLPFEAMGNPGRRVKCYWNEMGREGGKVPYKKNPKKDEKELDEVLGEIHKELILISLR